MDYEYIDGNIILHGADSFCVSETLECGQCFRFEKLDEEDYIIIAHGRILRIKEDKGNIVFFNTDIHDFENIWINYFDLERDYKSIKGALSKDDKILEKAVSYAPGIRILDQDFFECLISFIISQNNRIPMIKKVIKNISRGYGRFIGTHNGEDFYSFPEARSLASATEEALFACKTGFRAKYILDAVDKVMRGEVDFSDIGCKSTEEARQTLISIKGVGEKVSDCVLLFSCGRHGVFPTDVWVRRVMSELYFDGVDTSIKEIHNKARGLYGRNAGFAQQYLFNYARSLKIGK